MRYYNKENIELYHGDCMEVMDELINKNVKVDSIITDPPYEFNKGNNGWGVMVDNRKSHKEIHSNRGSKLKLDVGISNAFLEKTKLLFRNKLYNVILFCNSCQLLQLLNFANENNYLWNILVWHKTNPIPVCNNKYLDDIEYIFQMKEKGGKKIGGTYKTKSKVYISTVNKKDKIKYNHPTIKPLQLMEKLITNHTDKNDLVLDCYSGSGTTLEACQKLNRKGLGIEIEKNFCDTTIKRLSTIQTKMF